MKAVPDISDSKKLPISLRSSVATCGVDAKLLAAMGNAFIPAGDSRLEFIVSEQRQPKPFRKTAACIKRTTFTVPSYR
jgi:hypothetical protein